jgi:hypothetical protein
VSVQTPPAPELPARPAAPFHLSFACLLAVAWCLALALLGGALVMFAASDKPTLRDLEEVLDPTASEISILARAPVRLLWLHARTVGSALIWFAVLEIVALHAAHRMNRFALGLQILISGGMVGIALMAFWFFATISLPFAVIVGLLGFLPPGVLALSAAASYRRASSYSAVWPPVMLE